MLDSIDAVEMALRGHGYHAGRDLATRVFLARRLGKPLLLHGPAGSGRTSLAETLTLAQGFTLHRLVCHQSITPEEALFAWDTGLQVLHLRQAELAGRPLAERDVFTARYLLKRPLLEALTGPEPSAMLIEDVDRAPEAFQAWLAGVLSGGAVDVPHLGPVRPAQLPQAFLSATRAVTGELARACLVADLSYPPFEAEVEILVARVSGLPRAVAGQIAVFMARLREEQLRLPPGVEESIDLARAVLALQAPTLTTEVLDQALGCALRHPGDLAAVRAAGLARFARRSVDVTG